MEGLFKDIKDSILEIPPYSLGYPSRFSQSAYYPGADLKKSEIAVVSKVLEQNCVFPENTRVRRSNDGNGFDVLLASVETGKMGEMSILNDTQSVRLLRGDHSTHLQRVCAELKEASNYAANDTQKKFLALYVQSFQTGSLDTYRDSLRVWVQDKAPRVENIFGFVEPYRDPYGTRAEFEGLVAIADAEETRLLAKLVQQSATFIRRLPWATEDNDGKGPFEKSLFEPPDFASIHSK